MGTPKALLRLGEGTLLERALAAAGGRRTALVASGAVVATLVARAGVEVVCNDEPERGMSYSLHLANEALGEPHAALVVLLVDMPLVDAALVDRVLRGLAAHDVAYPVRGGIPGHPVVFGPRARARIAALPPGDTLRALRDDPALLRAPLPIEEDDPYADVDTPEDLARLRRG